MSVEGIYLYSYNAAVKHSTVNLIDIFQLELFRQSTFYERIKKFQKSVRVTGKHNII